MTITAINAANVPAPQRGTPPADGGSGSDGGSFAALLGQRREACKAARENASNDASAGANATPASAQKPATAEARRAERSPASRGERSAAKADSADKADAADRSDATRGTKDSDDDAAAQDAALPPWMLALQQPNAAAPQGDADAAAGTAHARGAAGGLLATGKGGIGKADGKVDGKLDAGADTKAGGKADAADAKADAKLDARAELAALQPASERLDAAAADAARETLAAAAANERKPIASTERPLGVDALAALGPAAPASPALDAAPAAATSSATLAAPIDTPDFAAALGVQVSVFARDGVQQAELQLNPLETGPVSVQIALDGNQARVHFGAEIAATRQAIEASLPELAAALRDAGFTLAGGGVSQQQRGRGDGTNDDGSGRGSRNGSRIGAASGDRSVDSVTPRATTRRVSAGGVDLYA